jgi:hypothetical protein
MSSTQRGALDRFMPFTFTGSHRSDKEPARMSASWTDPSPWFTLTPTLSRKRERGSEKASLAPSPTNAQASERGRKVTLAPSPALRERAGVRAPRFPGFDHAFALTLSERLQRERAQMHFSHACSQKLPWTRVLYHTDPLLYRPEGAEANWGLFAASALP